MIRFVRPEVVRLPISDGDTLTVKKHLTHGEQTAAFAQTYVVDGDGKLRPDPLRLEQSLVLAYLVDWTLLGLDGQPLVIVGQPVEFVAAALNQLFPDEFAEVKAAIEQHDQAVRAARAEEKKSRTGATASLATSPSPDAAVGVMSGSASSTPTST